MTALAIVNGAPGVLALAVVLGLRFPARRPAPALVRHLAERALDDFTWREGMRCVLRAADELATARRWLGVAP